METCLQMKNAKLFNLKMWFKYLANDNFHYSSK